MTHTLHRVKSENGRTNDYVVLIMPARGVNSQDSVEMFKKEMYIMKGSHSAASMKHDADMMVALAGKLLKGEELEGPDAEGYYQRGIRHQVWRKDGVNCADRAVDMLIAKATGKSFTSELIIPKKDLVPIAPALKDLSKAKIALATTGGIVPVDNPDRIQSASATRWGKYDISDMDRLEGGVFKTIHAGFDPAAANADPNVIMPVDVMKEFLKEGKMVDKQVGACSKDDGAKGDPAGSALLNMMNESNGRTLLGSSDVYVDDAGNFVCSSAVIAYVGRVNGLNGVPIRFDNLVRKTAVDVGGGYLVYDGDSLHEFASGRVALAAGTTFYRMRVESEIMGENASTGKQEMTGVKVVYYADRAGNADILPEPFERVYNLGGSYGTVLEKQDAELLNRADEIVTTSGLVVRRDANGEWIVDMENRYDSYIYVRIGDLWSAITVME